MQLVKVKDGLLELENFFITSPIEDFLGNGKYFRTPNEFILQDGNIERRIDYNELVIVVEKKDVELGPGDRYEFYLSDGEKREGIEESYNSEYARFWKLIYNDGYIQGYKSDDGLEWFNVGGKSAKSPIYQGFRTEGRELTLKNYRVYSDPYITIQNFYPGTLVKLVDIEGNLIKERLFEDNNECNIFLDHPIQGRLEFYDHQNNLIYKSKAINFNYGDDFIFTEYDLELYYKGQLLTHKTTTLYTLLETVVLRNNSDEIYSSINISINNANDDMVEISLDKENFHSELVVSEIQSKEEIEIYIRITKDKSNYFKMNDFTLEIS